MDQADVTSPYAQAIKAPLNPVAVGLAIFLFFPLGLYLLWKHPTLSRNKAWWWVGVAWTVLVCWATIGGWLMALYTGSLFLLLLSVMVWLVAKYKFKNPQDLLVWCIIFLPPLGLYLLWRDPVRRYKRAWWIGGGIWTLLACISLADKAMQAPEVAANPAMSNGTGGSTAQHNGGFFTSTWDYKNGSQVIYDDSVTKEEAKRLGDYLEGQGFFDDDTKTLKIDRVDKTYEFRAVIKKGIEQDPEAIEVSRQLALELSQTVFGGAEVDIHLCDDKFNTIRVVVPIR